MSRVRRLSYAIDSHGRRANSLNQASRLRDAALSIVDNANANASTSRRITKKAAFTVVLRSLEKTRSLPFSLREHTAMRELSRYISLAQHDKIESLTLSHTDLLPLSHPRSTRQHSMTASALRNARSRWYSDDPRITDERAQIILASAFSSDPGSVEHTYYSSILSGLAQGVIPAEALIAVGDPFSGGNSSAERSLRARLQRRDRKGQFAFMGGGLSALVRKADGLVYNFLGRPLVDGPGSDDIQMELPDGKIVNIPASKGVFRKATLTKPGQGDGYSTTPAKASLADVNIINQSDLVFVDSPNGWNKIADSVWSNGTWNVTKNKNGKFSIDRDTSNGKKETILGDFKSWDDVLNSLDEYDDKEKNKKANLPKPEAQKENKKFEFDVPEGGYKIKQGQDYDPEGRVDEESTDFTDDPAELAQNQDPRDLIAALEQAVLPQDNNKNAFAYGPLRFNRGDELVPANAIYNALKEAGEDADLELARIYDKGLGSKNNEKALLDSRKGEESIGQASPQLEQSFKRITEEGTPDVVPAAVEEPFVEESRDLTPLPPLLEGMSESEIARFTETKDHTPYLPTNEDIQMPEGYNTLNPAPFESWQEITPDNPSDVLPEGFSDNPVFLSQEIPKSELLQELRRSIEPGNEAPGYGAISLNTDDGDKFTANVPGEAIRDALQLQGVDTNEEIKKISEEGMSGQKDEGQIAELPLDTPAEPKKLNAYEKLMAENQAAKDAVTERMAQLDKAAVDRVDEQGRSIPEGWGIEKKNKPYFGALDRPENHFNVYGLNNFEAQIDDSGKITIKDRNKLLEDKSYQDWNEVQADLNARKAEYAKATREEIKKYAKNDNYSDEQIAAFDSMSQEEIADFFNNPDNHTPEYANALDDFNTSWAVDAPRPAQRERWAAFAKEQRIQNQAGDFPSSNSPVAELPAEPKISERKPDTTTQGKKNFDVKAMLNEEEALADKYQDEEGMDRGDAQAVAESDMIRKYGLTAFEALNQLSREDALQLLEERDNEKKNQEIATPPKESKKKSTSKDKNIIKEINDGDLLDRRLAGESLDAVAEDLRIPREEVRRREMDALRKRRELDQPGVDSQGQELTPVDVSNRPKELSEAEIRVLDNNALVEEIAGLLVDIPAIEIKVGDFFYNRFYNRYEEIRDVKYIGNVNGVYDRVEFEVFNVANNQLEMRYLKADSPIRNMRRPGIEDQIAPKRATKGKARGGKRGLIARKPLSERVLAKDRPMAGKINDEAGFFIADNGVALQPGDVVRYKKPGKDAIFGRGVIKHRVGAQVEEGAKARGLVRGKGDAKKIVIDELWIQWENEDRKYALKQGGVPAKARNLVFQVDGVDGIDLPAFAGGRVLPNIGRDPGIAIAPDVSPKAAPAAPGMPEQIFNNKFKDLNGGNFEINLIKIDDIYEGALVDNNLGEDPADARIQIVVRNKDKKIAMEALVDARDIITSAANGQEALPDIPNLDNAFLGNEQAPRVRPLVDRDLGRDKETDLREQIEQAIVDRNDVSFIYNGKVRNFTPKSIFTNPLNGNINVRGFEGDVMKVFTIQKMDFMENNAPVQQKLLEVEKEKPKVNLVAPKPVFDLQVRDANGRKFNIEVANDNGIFVAKAFADDNNEVNGTIGKNSDIQEIQKIIGNFVGDIIQNPSGEDIVDLYAGNPKKDEAKQLVLTNETAQIPDVPEVKDIPLKEAKLRAKKLAEDLDKKVLGPVGEYQQFTVDRVKNEIMRLAVGPAGDRRQRERFKKEMLQAAKGARQLGLFDEAAQLYALAELKPEIPLRKMESNFYPKIEALKNTFGPMVQMRRKIKNDLPNVNKDFGYDNLNNKLRDAQNGINEMILKPDVYNPFFRNGYVKAKNNIDGLLKELNGRVEPEYQELKSEVEKIKSQLDAFGDLPKLPARKQGDLDVTQKRLAEIAREMSGMDVAQIINGFGDWSLDKNISDGINKVYLLKNKLTGEQVVIKYDDDNRYYPAGKVFNGNGIKAEEMVAVLYRDLGFASPAFQVANPDNPDKKVGGVGVMEYAGPGFFGLVNAKIQRNKGIYSLNQVSPEHREELLNFLVANAIVGNTDRHGGNFMWGTGPDGLERLIPIDNGLAIMHGAFGDAEKNEDNPLFLDPIKTIVGKYGSQNGVGRLAKKYVEIVGDDVALKQIEEFATRMRERAAAIKLIDDRANPYIDARAEYILNNKEKFLDALKGRF